MSLQIFPLLFVLISWAFFSLVFYQTGFFEYLLRFYVHFLQISQLGLQELATFGFSFCFWLVPFHEGSKMISKTSRPYGKFFTVVKLSAMLQILLSCIPLLAIPLMKRMSISLFHDMTDLRKGENRLVYNFFKNLRQKDIPRVKKSNVKWKCEKDIVQNYSVTGNLE